MKKLISPLGIQVRKWSMLLPFSYPESPRRRRGVTAGMRAGSDQAAEPDSHFALDFDMRDPVCNIYYGSIVSISCCPLIGTCSTEWDKGSNHGVSKR